MGAGPCDWIGIFKNVPLKKICGELLHEKVVPPNGDQETCKKSRKFDLTPPSLRMPRETALQDYSCFCGFSVLGKTPLRDTG